MKGQLKFVIIILGLAYVLSMSLAPSELFKDGLSAFITVFGAIAIFYQLKKEKDISEGSFILELNNTFSDDKGIKIIYDILKKNSNSESKGYLTEEHRSFIDDYLTFFETIYILYKKRIFSIKELDQMFAYRFFLIINDPLVRELELRHNIAYYSTLYELYKDWADFRKKHDLEIFKEDSDFQKFYEKNVIQD